MSYTVLARRYRPETFGEVVGQEWISKTLGNAIKKGRVAHAFLFSGPRGVGKTSMARILSKALNCENGPTGTPCLTCVHCTSITRGNDVDVLEIDAASNRGIDHIRALRENVRYVPVSGRFKIYIIDEVHMLTMESFNALLKTLEEPPEHVKFIFATTEPQKMPETVRSRCQCYEFRRITSSAITERLKLIAGKESIDCEPGVLERIAQLSRGGLRDAESLLDQIASLGEGRATFEALNALTGRLSPREMGDLVDAVLEENTNLILDFIDRVFASGTQGEDLIKDLIDYLRALLLTRAGASGHSLLPADLEERCRAQGEKTDLDRILACMQIALETLRKGRWFDDERILTEMALLKMASLSRSFDLAKALSFMAEGKPDDSPSRPGGASPRADPSSRGGGPSSAKASPGAGPTIGHSRGSMGYNIEGPSAGTPRSGPARSHADPSALYKKILPAIERESKTLAIYLSRLKVKSLKGDTFELEVPPGQEWGPYQPESPEISRKLSNASEGVLDQSYKFNIIRAMGSVPDAVPPIVKKTLDLFEGETI